MVETYWDRRRRLREQDELEKKKTRKCPACNSNKTHENEKYFTCDKCGYLNKKEKVLRKWV